MVIFYKLFLFVGILLGVVGQLALKKSTKTGLHFEKRIIKTLLKMYTNLYFILAAITYALSMAIFVIVISHVDLSYAYPIVSLNFVLVSIASKLVFKEKISKKRWISMTIITLGVILIAMS